MATATKKTTKVVLAKITKNKKKKQRRRIAEEKSPPTTEDDVVHVAKTVTKPLSERSSSYLFGTEDDYDDDHYDSAKPTMSTKKKTKKKKDKDNKVKKERSETILVITSTKDTKKLKRKDNTAKKQKTTKKKKKKRDGPMGTSSSRSISSRSKTNDDSSSTGTSATTIDDLIKKRRSLLPRIPSTPLISVEAMETLRYTSPRRSKSFVKPIILTSSGSLNLVDSGDKTSQDDQNDNHSYLSFHEDDTRTHVVDEDVLMDAYIWLSNKDKMANNNELNDPTGIFQKLDTQVLPKQTPDKVLLDRAREMEWAISWILRKEEREGSYYNENNKVKRKSIKKTKKKKKRKTKKAIKKKKGPKDVERHKEVKESSSASSAMTFSNKARPMSWTPMSSSRSLSTVSYFAEGETDDDDVLDVSFSSNASSRPTSMSTLSSTSTTTTATTTTSATTDSESIADQSDSKKTKNRKKKVKSKKHKETRKKTRVKLKKKIKKQAGSAGSPSLTTCAVDYYSEGEDGSISPLYLGVDDSSSVAKLDDKVDEGVVDDALYWLTNSKNMDDSTRKLQDSTGIFRVIDCLLPPMAPGQTLPQRARQMERAFHRLVTDDNTNPPLTTTATTSIKTTVSTSSRDTRKPITDRTILRYIQPPKAESRRPIKRESMKRGTSRAKQSLEKVEVGTCSTAPVSEYENDDKSFTTNQVISTGASFCANKHNEASVPSLSLSSKRRSIKQEKEPTEKSASVSETKDSSNGRGDEKLLEQYGLWKWLQSNKDEVHDPTGMFRKVDSMVPQIPEETLEQRVRKLSQAMDWMRQRGIFQQVSDAPAEEEENMTAHPVPPSSTKHRKSLPVVATPKETMIGNSNRMKGKESSSNQKLKSKHEKTLPNSHQSRKKRDVQQVLRQLEDVVLATITDITKQTTFESSGEDGNSDAIEASVLSRPDVKTSGSKMGNKSTSRNESDEKQAETTRKKKKKKTKRKIHKTSTSRSQKKQNLESETKIRGGTGLKKQSAAAPEAPTSSSRKDKVAAPASPSPAGFKVLLPTKRTSMAEYSNRRITSPRTTTVADKHGPSKTGGAKDDEVPSSASTSNKDMQLYDSVSDLILKPASARSLMSYDDDTDSYSEEEEELRDHNDNIDNAESSTADLGFRVDFDIDTSIFSTNAYNTDDDDNNENLIDENDDVSESTELYDTDDDFEQVDW